MKNIEVRNTGHDPNCPDCLTGIESKHSVVTLLDDVIEKQLDVRDKVFRPSNVPTMTLAEFGDKEKARMAEQENAPKMRDIEGEDSEDEEVSDLKTYKARYWDDWKDLNEKGGGNKKR